MRSHSIFYRLIVFACVSPGLAACGMRVPSLTDDPLDAPMSPQGPNVLVIDVVQRVKCELYKAVRGHLPVATLGAKDKKELIFDKKDSRLWFSKWDATTKLELVLNDQSGVAPGLTFTSPLVNGYNFAGGPSSIPLHPGTAFTPMVGSVAQNFSFAIGGTASTQSFRTDDVQFTVSLSELVKEFEFGLNDDQKSKLYMDCMDEGHELPENAFLESNLGLKEWIDSAMGPTEPKEPWLPAYLTEGYHPVVSAQGPSNPPKPAATASTAGGRKAAVVLPPQEQIVEELKSIDTQLSTLKKSLDVLKDNFEKVVTPIFSLVSNLPGLCPQVEAAQAKDFGRFELAAQGLFDDANKLADIVRKATIVADDQKPPTGGMRLSDAESTLDSVRQDISLINQNIAGANHNAGGLYAAYTQCKKQNKSAPQPKDPPIDNLTHSVQFILAAGANATPSWTFVRIKTGSSPLLSVSHSYTQTLSIVLASPSGGKASPSAEQQLLGLGFQSDLNRLLSQ